MSLSDSHEQLKFITEIIFFIDNFYISRIALKWPSWVENQRTCFKHNGNCLKSCKICYLKQVKAKKHKYVHEILKAHMDFICLLAIIHIKIYYIHTKQKLHYLDKCIGLSLNKNIYKKDTQMHIKIYIYSSHIFIHILFSQAKMQI